MSSRVANRRKAKEEKRKKAIYNLTGEQLDTLISEGIAEGLDEYKAEVYSEAVRDAFIMIMVFPLMVLKDNYWKKSFCRKAEKFANEVVDLYDSWQNGDFSIDELKENLWELGKVRLERGKDD